MSPASAFRWPTSRSTRIWTSPPASASRAIPRTRTSRPGSSGSPNARARKRAFTRSRRREGCAAELARHCQTSRGPLLRFGPDGPRFDRFARLGGDQLFHGVLAPAAIARQARGSADERALERRVTTLACEKALFGHSALTAQFARQRPRVGNSL